MKTFIQIFIMFSSCFIATAVRAQQPAIDTANLFTNKNGALVLQSQRQVSPKHLQIINFAGRSVLLKMSLDLKTWVNVTLKSPEKKVFICPGGVNELYVIIDPDNPKAVKKVISRNEKYELFYNKSTKLYDIMKIVNRE